MPVESPVVSVIIATYNWSSVLRYSIQSVLWQTFRDFELLVIGDGCTDDSEDVVASFDDPRIRWFNLPENFGNQAAPNNKGIELARGEHIAYLGHDDIWYPTHLQHLVSAIQDADAAFSVAECILSADGSCRYLTGLTTSEPYDPHLHTPPSSFMHRRNLVEKIGGWGDYRRTRLPNDYEFISRLRLSGARFVPTNELTAFKFTAASRRNSYVEKPSSEQETYVKRIQTEPDFQYRELMDVLKSVVTYGHDLVYKMEIPTDASPGALVEFWRSVKGLSPKPPLDAEEVPLYQNIQLIQMINRTIDIVPLKYRQQLNEQLAFPDDGLFVGLNWSFAEYDERGRAFRWVNNDAEIVITKATGMQQKLALEIEWGPGVNYQPFQLALFDTTGQNIATVTVKGLQLIEIPLSLKASEGAVFRLHTDDGGRQVESDPRILNFRVWNVDWAGQAETPILNTAFPANPEQNAQHQERDPQPFAAQLARFRLAPIRHVLNRASSSSQLLKRWWQR